MKNNIRVERAILRISQQELADAIGVTRQTIYAIENDKFIPSTELALKMSAYGLVRVICLRQIFRSDSDS